MAYDFDMLAADLAIGHEIEFEYNSTKYSITCFENRTKILYDDSHQVLIHEFISLRDKHELASILIGNTTLEAIFRESLFDATTLYIL